jgi:hypothetical protein
MFRIREIVGERAVFLNYKERDRWDRSSLPVQLFHIFGPHPTSDRFMPNNLPPTVIVFRIMKAPRKFIFGNRAEEPEARLEQLGIALAPAATV